MVPVSMDPHVAAVEFKKKWSEKKGPLFKNDVEEMERFLLGHGGTVMKPNVELALAAAKILAGEEENRWVADRWMMSGDPYLGMVSVLTYGQMAAAYPHMREEIVPILRHSLFHKSKLVRESVVLSIKELAKTDPGYAAHLLEEWAEEGYPVMLRLGLVVLSDGELLRRYPNLINPLRSLCVKSMALLAFHSKETGEPVRELKKVVPEAIAVLATRDPETGFSLMKEWAAKPELRPFVKKALGDKKLRARHPDRVENMLKWMKII